MESSEAQRLTSSNPTAVLASLLGKRNKLHDDLRTIEKQVYEMETSYLHDFGNALKGFEGYLSSTKGTSNIKRSKKFQPEDRIFSLSSVTSPVAEEFRVGGDDGKSELGQGRAKGRGLQANGQGKPKKGRTAQRDGKRNRPSSEPDLDYEDDPDMSLR